ncbi:hypothetical protein RFI_36958 [Reticulomyxa filosa]|uniref:Uncharacterized protein n=1 Tax=Reticulomyxa filosa TaxID=46433 RepID=X6LH92_RETFI|nr:hypothetical protein RFI_36958 [Reticulomyxa filosa]|eukprot:ETO00482.1 hypothetical protein RFI_36958 [Reticulomyxa filosa]
MRTRCSSRIGTYVVIDMFKRTQNEYAVITSYPKATGKDLLKWRPPIATAGTGIVAICKTKQLAGNYMFKHDRGHFIENPGKPVLTPFFAAGMACFGYWNRFSFSKGHRLLAIPTDPYLPYLFDGEEILMSLRLWTFGYDLYLPDTDVIYHIYEQYYKRPLFWNDDWNIQKKTAVRTAQNWINYVLQLYEKYPKRGQLDVREIDKYGLGKERDPAQFWKWIDYDFQKMESPEFCNLLKKEGFERVPINSDLAKNIHLL